MPTFGRPTTATKPAFIDFNRRPYGRLSRCAEIAGACAGQRGEGDAADAETKTEPQAAEPETSLHDRIGAGWGSPEYRGQFANLNESQGNCRAKELADEDERACGSARHGPETRAVTLGRSFFGLCREEAGGGSGKQCHHRAA
ncbi:MAG: hypothetical protein HY260_15480 [Chloroflexi bacterium]|nr:hypothetical protein [Chloroflexota bacterium]